MDKDLPREYGENIMRVMVQGPQVLFVYWEMAEVSWNSLYFSPELYLRLYQLVGSGFENHILLREVSLPPFSDNWYFYEAQAETRYVCELGLREKDGFVSVLRSNIALTPALPVEVFIPQLIPPETLVESSEFGEIPAPLKQAGQTELTTLQTLSVPKVLQEMPFYTGIKF